MEVPNMRQIPLSQGKVAFVDVADFPLLSGFKWCYRGEKGKTGYAVRRDRNGPAGKLLYLHKVICPAPPGHETIFLNHQTLDCRRENLMAVTKTEARQHHRVRRDSKSGAKCVR